MMLPEFATSLTMAETKAFEIITHLTAGICGLTRGVISDTPVRHGSFAFRLTSPDASDPVFLSAHKYPCLAYGGSVTGAFKSREEAQIFVMLLIAGLPILDNEEPSDEPLGGRIQQIRLTSISEVEPVVYDGDNEPKPWAHTVTVKLDIVFLTGKRDVETE